jgi:HlyD family secretion protein
MDILREDLSRQRRRKRVILGAAGVLAALVITLGLSRLKPAAPSVEQTTLWIDTVKRGPMLRQVRGPGSLVPEEIRLISAPTEGRVERILLQPGTPVTPSSVLLVLSNPELVREALDTVWELKAAQAALTNVRVGLESQLMNQKAAAATVQADYKQALLQAETNEGLFKEGLIADLTLKLSTVRAEELKIRHDLEQQRLVIAADSAKAQVAVSEAQVQQLRALSDLKRSQVEALQVRAGIEGVLQELPLQTGQRVMPGTMLARVVQPLKLKAQIRIAETQAKDIEIGQPASIDTRNGIVPGRVSRVDPASQNGTVTVDVALGADLPRGARPDLSVDGTIELDRLSDVIFVGRPAFGQEQSQVGLFRLSKDGDHATRVKVRLGKSSVNTVQILEGLIPGDRVILSDMSAWDSFDRVRLD